MKDLEYIKNFTPIAHGANLVQDYKNIQVAKSVSSFVYPQLYAFLVQNFEEKEVIRRLRELGRRAVTIFYSVNQTKLKKAATIPNIFMEIGKHSGEKIQIKNIVKKKKVVQSCLIKKYKCIFCTESYKMENIEVPFCYPSLAFFQHYYNLRSLYLGNLKPRLIHLEMVKTAEHDKDYCLYRMEAID
ncbi:MAG: hypothetical protein ACTSYB_16405 [Candidatus Helarchaeota archaeon]